MMTAFSTIALYLITFTYAHLEDLGFYDHWTIKSDFSLPTPPAAIAYSTTSNTLFFLGGINAYNTKQLASYDVISQETKDLGVTALSSGIYVGAQMYAQIGSLLYIADNNDEYINTFDVDTTSMETYVLPLSGLTTRSCFVNIDDRYLGVILETGSVQIYDTELDEWYWMYLPPNTKRSRYDASCVYQNDYLYIVGGQNLFGIVYDDMEYINITSVLEAGIESWTSKVLPHAIVHSRLLAVDDEYNQDIILIMGGTDHVSVFDTVYILDTVSMEITTGGYMAEKIYSQSVISIDDKTFCFGGYKGVSDTNPSTGVQINDLHPEVLSTTSSNANNGDNNDGADTKDEKGSDTEDIVIVVVVVIVVILIVFVVVFCMKRSGKRTQQSFDHRIKSHDDDEMEAMDKGTL